MTNFIIIFLLVKILPFIGAFVYTSLIVARIRNRYKPIKVRSYTVIDEKPVTKSIPMISAASSAPAPCGRDNSRMFSRVKRDYSYSTNK